MLCVGKCQSLAERKEIEMLNPQEEEMKVECVQGRERMCL